MLKTQIIGHLGKDAEVRELANAKVLEFNVAHTRKIKGQDATVWVKVQRWYKPEDQIGVAQYLKKGTQVFCEGEPKTEGWKTDAGEVATRLVLTIYNNDGLQLLGGGKSESVQQTNTDKYDPKAPPQNAPVGTPDDLPF